MSMPQGYPKHNVFKRILSPMYYKLWVLPRIHWTYRNLSTSEAFQRIYATGAWGGDSGHGSRGIPAEHSVELVSTFIKERGLTTVVDLGCGDFQVGRAIVARTGVQYTGVDIVPTLIDSHSRKFPQASFVCANVTTDTLPKAELCLVRQVLQHLSNAEIEALLRNIAQYPLALISEHVPLNPKCFNLDKPHGPDVRAYWGSGVYVDRAPFSRSVSQEWQFEFEPGALLRTVLIAS